MGDLSLREVAKKLRLSYRQVLRLVKTRRLDSRRNGRERVVSAKSVYRYFENGR